MLVFNLGLVEDEFEESVKMSTYLVAFIVCDGYNRTRNTTESGVEVWFELSVLHVGTLIQRIGLV